MPRLPLNYVPDVVQRLHDQIKAHQFALVENEVATWTLAEIIMAGYDQRPTSFKIIMDGYSNMTTNDSVEVRGQTAIDYEHGSEIGPDANREEGSSIEHAVKDVLYHLLARLDRAPNTRRQLELSPQIADYALRLHELLKAKSNTQQQRTIYYVLELPNEVPGPKGHKREFLIQVISEVCRLVPQLILVELAPFQKHAGETELEWYVRCIQTDVRLTLTHGE